MKTEDVVLLKELSEKLVTEQAGIRQKRAGFEATILNEVDTAADLLVQIEQVKGLLTTEAIAEFEETGEKKLLGGIGIKVMNTISWDSGKALSFAKEKDMFLTLDEKAFKKVAGSLGVDFVTTGTKTTVTFPKEIKIND